MYKITESIPSEFCSPERLQKLKSAGIDTDGHIDQLKAIIKDNGFNLPGEVKEGFVFIFQKKYTRIYLTLVDACAELMLLLREYKMI